MLKWHGALVTEVFRRFFRSSQGPSWFSVVYDSVAQDLLETPQSLTLVRKTMGL